MADNQQSAVMYCPRCDRQYTDTTDDKVLDQVKTHVQGQHPDYDPEWWDTYPTDPYGN